MNKNTISYEQAKDLKIAAYNFVNYTSKKLCDMSKTSGQYKLILNDTKARQEYKIAMADYTNSINELLQFKIWFNKTYEKQCALERKNKTLALIF